MDHFRKPLEFTSLEEVEKYLLHEPWSYYDTDTDTLDCIEIVSYRSFEDIQKILVDQIYKGVFKILEIPKIFQNDDIKKPGTNIYYFNVKSDMDILIGIRKKNNNIIILLSMDKKDILKYYKYVFMLADIFDIKLQH